MCWNENQIKGINSKLNNAKEQRSDLEDGILEITHSEEQTKNKWRKMKAKDLWDNIKYANLCIIGIPEGEEREKGVENVLEKLKKIMAENLPNLKKETYIQVQEA